MKGDNTQCIVCNKVFVAKRKNHKFCSNAYRQENHRQKHNIKKPTFLAKNNNTSISHKELSKLLPVNKKTEVKNFNDDDFFNSIGVSPLPSRVDNETKVKAVWKIDGVKKIYEVGFFDLEKDKEAFLNNRKYWLNILHRSNKGIPFGVFGGIGAAYGKLEKESWGAAAGYGLMGLLIDSIIRLSEKDVNEQKEKIRKKALREIELIDNNINQINELQKEIIEMQKQKMLSIPNSENEPIKVIRKGNLLTAEAYKNLEIKGIGLTGKYKYLLGDISGDFSMIIHGESGNGKSTFSVDFANELTKYGSVLYCPYEQSGENKAFQDLIREKDGQFSISMNPPIDIEEFKKMIKDYDFVFVDSVNYARFNSLDFKDIRKRNKDLGLIGIMQNNKKGEPKGDSNFVYDCDIRVELKQGVAYQEKSRFLKSRSSIKVWDNDYEFEAN